jgi:4-amino-4-deoxy-L-arabinose transferase-like glycosyltransferase
MKQLDVLRTDYRLAAVAVILLAFAARLVVAATLGLGVDESYAVAVSRLPSWSFYDHPPLGFMLARWSAMLLGSESPVIVRLPYLLLFAGSAWLLFRLTERLFNERAGFWAVAWLNVAPFFFFSAGGFVVPDGPLVFFLLATANLFAHIVLERQDRPPLWQWLLLGLVFGLALLSKYQAVLAGVGALGFLLTSKRGRTLLAQPGFYAAMLVALACFAPVVIWNYQHGWASFAFQSGRAVSGHAWTPTAGLANTLRLLAGEVLYLLPGPFILALVVLALALVGGPRDERRWFLLWLALPAVLVFNGLAPLMRGSLPHWSMPGFLFAFPLIGAFIDQRWPAGNRFLRWNYITGIAIVAVVIVIGVAQINGGLFTRFFNLPPKWDRTDTIQDWDDLHEAFAARGWFEPGKYVVAARSWIEAAKLDYALRGRVPVLVISNDRRHFQFLHDRAELGDREALLVTLAQINGVNAARQRLIDEAAGEFDDISDLPPAFLTRGGRDYMQFVILQARFRKGFAAH